MNTNTPQTAGVSTLPTAAFTADTLRTMLQARCFKLDSRIDSVPQRLEPEVEAACRSAISEFEGRLRDKNTTPTSTEWLNAALWRYCLAGHTNDAAGMRAATVEFLAIGFTLLEDKELVDITLDGLAVTARGQAAASVFDIAAYEELKTRHEETVRDLRHSHDLQVKALQTQIASLENKLQIAETPTHAPATNTELELSMQLATANNKIRTLETHLKQVQAMSVAEGTPHQYDERNRELVNGMRRDCHQLLKMRQAVTLLRHGPMAKLVKPAAEEADKEAVRVLNKFMRTVGLLDDNDRPAKGNNERQSQQQTSRRSIEPGQVNGRPEHMAMPSEPRVRHRHGQITTASNRVVETPADVENVLVPAAPADVDQLLEDIKTIAGE